MPPEIREGKAPVARLPHTHSLTHTLSLSHTHTHSHSHKLSHTLTHSLSHTQETLSPRFDAGWSTRGGVQSFGMATLLDFILCLKDKTRAFFTSKA